MPGIVAIVTAISNQVIARLADKGYPPLTDGKILLGRQRQFESSAPPRIIMTPTDSPFGAVDTYSRAPAGTEGRTQMAQRSIATEFVRFEVRCWGTSASGDPTVVRDDDYDVTQALYHAVIQAVSAPSLSGGAAVAGPFTAGGVELEAGTWTDATFSSSQDIAYGREFVFGLKLATPILDRLFAYAPSDVAPVTKSYMTTPDGTSSQGCGA